MGLIVARRLLPDRGKEQKTYIKVVVLPDLFPGGYAVDIEVEYLQGPTGGGGNAGLLENLPRGDPEQIKISVGVTPGLEPPVEFAVVNEEHPLS